MILHIDMDAFYASASLLERPDLVGQPVIVGGGGRGVVLSATYEARRSGVSSGMPMGRARRLCPQAIVLVPNHDLYAQISGAIMHLFRQVTPSVEPISLDEAFLDLSGVARDMADAVRIGHDLRDAVNDEQGITCSVGVAPVKFVAKVASGAAKPDGLRLVKQHEVLDFLHPLPIEVLWGVGPSAQEKLHRLGLRTIGDIAHLPTRTLTRAVGQAAGTTLHELAWGHDSRRVVPHEPERSIGSDETFAEDIDDPHEIRRHLLKLSDRVTARMRSAQMTGRTVVLKVRFSDFTTVSRSRTLPEYTDVSREVHATAVELFDGLGLQRARVRLVGVRVQGLRDRQSTSRQGRLGEREFGWREADLAVDRASSRFGAGAVRPASLVGR